MTEESHIDWLNKYKGIYPCLHEVWLSRYCQWENTLKRLQFFKNNAFRRTAIGLLSLKTNKAYKIDYKMKCPYDVPYQVSLLRNFFIISFSRPQRKVIFLTEILFFFFFYFAKKISYFTNYYCNMSFNIFVRWIFFSSLNNLLTNIISIFDKRMTNNSYTLCDLWSKRPPPKTCHENVFFTDLWMSADISYSFDALKGQISPVQQGPTRRTFSHSMA